MSEYPTQRTAFLALTGYGPDDLLAANPATRTFMTMNGGIYQLAADLKTVKRLKGPAINVEDRLMN